MAQIRQMDPKYDNVYAALTVQGERTEIKISAHTVCLASPVWRKALTFPTLPVKEDNQTESLDSSTESSLQTLEKGLVLQSLSPAGNKIDEYELVAVSLRFPEWISFQQRAGHDEHAQARARKILDLTEDDADSVLLLLRIAHLQFDKVPLKLPFNSLLKIAELCDYYNCTNLVQPWRSLWLADGAVESKKPGQEHWLTIAWIFGEDKIFNELAEKVVREVRINDKPECLTNEGEIFALSLPLGIVEEILDSRHRTILALLNVLYSRVDNYIAAITNNTTICSHENEKTQCDALTYGSLLMRLQTLGLWPRKSPIDIHMSINDLVSRLTSVKIIKLPSKYNDTHLTCGLSGYIEEIPGALDSIACPTLASNLHHGTHMR